MCCCACVCLCTVVPLCMHKCACQALLLTVLTWACVQEQHAGQHEASTTGRRRLGPHLCPADHGAAPCHVATAATKHTCSCRQLLQPACQARCRQQTAGAGVTLRMVCRMANTTSNRHPDRAATLVDAALQHAATAETAAVQPACVCMC